MRSTRRLSRVLWLLQHLQRHQRVTVTDACRDLGISERTYRRDIALLRASGVILHGFSRPEGGMQYLGFEPSAGPVAAA